MVGFSVAVLVVHGYGYAVNDFFGVDTKDNSSFSWYFFVRVALVAYADRCIVNGSCCGVVQRYTYSFIVGIVGCYGF